MTTLREYKRAMWIKGVLIGLPMAVGMYFIALLMNHLTRDDTVSPLYFFFLVIAIVLCWPLLMKAFSPPKRKATSEYDEIESAYEEKGDSLIVETFGTRAFDALFIDDHNWFPSYAIDTCMQLLRKEESESNPELRSYLLFKLANYYVKDGRLKEAVGTLQEALAIEPRNLIANYRIAFLFERVGSAEEAIMHYRLAHDSSASDSLKNYLERQIQRVRTSGPKQDGPFDNNSFQWLPG